MNMKAAFSLLAAASLAFSSVAFGGAKTYEVTGPVLEVNDSMIVVAEGERPLGDESRRQYQGHR